MAEPEGGGGGGLGKKIGPLPTWGWAVLLGGVGGIIWFLRKSQASAAAAAATNPNGAGTSDTPDQVPTTIVPVNQGLGDQQAQALLDAIKKLQGEESEEEEDDDDHDDDDKPKPKPKPKPQPKPKPKPKPKPQPKPKPKSRPYVITKKWNRVHAPWQSTLWGIANHYHTPGGWQHLQKINHMHGDPRTHLQPNQKIYLS